MRTHLTILWIIGLVVLSTLWTPSVVRADVTVWKQIGANGGGPGEFASAVDGLLFDPNQGRMYAKELAGPANVFDTSGTWMAQWGQGVSALANDARMFMDDAGFIYVVDSDNHCVLKFVGDGQLVLTFGSRGSEPGQFFYPFDGDYNPVNHLLYVSDQMNHRVQLFTTNGEYRGTVGPVGVGPEPYAVTVDPQIGDVYITYFNAANVEEVRKFSSTGVQLAQWGSYGSGPGQFHQPFDVAVDELHRVYIPDRYNYRVQTFDSNGNYLGQFGDQTIFNLPSAVAFDNQGRLWVTNHYPNADNNHIVIFYVSGLPTPTQATTWGRLKALYR